MAIPGVIDSKDFIQHEHALITVDDNCQMTLWDQYGDNKEQSDVDEAVADLVEVIFPS